MQDRLLLRRFVEHDSQAAFAKIVGRYLRLVYSTCLREVGDHYLAEDVTQGVFLILAQKAPSLGRHVPLAGWLFRTAQLASKNAIRQEQRRRRREHAMESETGGAWPWARRHPQEASLNEALAALRPGEREAILLRFFEEMPFKEVGETLGLSEDTAQKRVSRALEKMRTHLTRHGEALSLAALIGVLTPEASQAVLDRCGRPLLHIIPGLKITLDTSSLFGSRAYQISQRAIRIMKAKTAMTAMSVSILVVGAVSLLMAGADKTQGSIVGTWVTTKVDVGEIPRGATKPIQITDIETWRFKSDDTLTVTTVLTVPGIHKTGTQIMTGRYSVTGKSLTIFPMHTTDGSRMLSHVTGVMIFSDGGKVLTLKDNGQTLIPQISSMVLTRQ